MTSVINQSTATTENKRDVALRRVVFAVLCTGFVVTSLDMMIVNVAFPELDAEFPGYGESAISWTLNAYTIIFAAALIPAGRMADQIGRRRGFLLGLVVFTVASAICAAAVSLPMLIAARVVQALGAALLAPTSMGLLLQVYPKELQQSAVRTWTAAGGVAAAMAPIIGGLLVQLDWRWIFLINVPIGVVALAVGAKVLPTTTGQGGPMPDPVGSLAVVIASSALVFGLIEGPDGWLRPVTLGAFALAITAVAVLVARIRTHELPVIPTGLLTISPYVRANVAAFVFSASFSVMLLSVVLWTQQVRGYSAIQTGLAIAPGTLLMPFFAVWTGKIAKVIGAARTAGLGCVLLAAGMAYWVVTAPTDLPYAAAVMPGSILTSIGTILANAALIGIVAAVLPRSDYAVGSAVHTMLKQLGIAVGVALFVAIDSSVVAGGQTPLRGFQVAWVAAAVVGVIAAGACAAIRLPSTADQS